jgi:hypothetical protein
MTDRERAVAEQAAAAVESANLEPPPDCWPDWRDWQAQPKGPRERKGQAPPHAWGHAAAGKPDFAEKQAA